MVKSYFLSELKYKLLDLCRHWGGNVALTSIALLISIGAVCFTATSTSQRIDLHILEYFFSQRGQRQAPQDVVIVALDDGTYKNLDVSTRWPFPRHFTADALEKIVAALPKVFILDVKIPKEDNDPVADERIEKALKAGPTTIWSGEMSTTYAERRQAGTSLAADQENINADASITIPSDKRFRDAAKMELSMQMLNPFNVAYLIAAHINESDKIEKRVPLAKPLIELGGFDIIAPGAEDLINFYGESGTIKRVSLFEVIKMTAEELQAKLKDKVVLFGYQSIGRARGQSDKDEYSVSVSSNPMFGVEIHANIVGNLLDRSWLKVPQDNNDKVIVFLTVIWMAIIGIFLSPEKGAPTVLGLILAELTAAYIAFSKYQYWLPGISAIVLSGLTIILFGALYHYIIIKKFREYVKKTFNFELDRDV